MNWAAAGVCTQSLHNHVLYHLLGRGVAVEEPDRVETVRAPFEETVKVFQSECTVCTPTRSAPEFCSPAKELVFLILDILKRTHGFSLCSSFAFLSGPMVWNAFSRLPSAVFCVGFQYYILKGNVLKSWRDPIRRIVLILLTTAWTFGAELRNLSLTQHRDLILSSRSFIALRCTL